MRERLQALADRDVERWPRMPGRLIHVLSPDRDIDLEVAAGVADHATGEPLAPGSRFRIASVTKPFVGSAALRLVEMGHLDLDASLDDLLAGTTTTILGKGGYDTAEITLQQLMTHTSGIYDFAASVADPSIDDGFDAAIAADPTHRWTREEQLRFAVDHGEPYGPPGAVYSSRHQSRPCRGRLLKPQPASAWGPRSGSWSATSASGCVTRIRSPSTRARRSASVVPSVRTRGRRAHDRSVGRPLRRRRPGLHV